MLAFGKAGRSRRSARLRFAGSWALALALVGIGLPRAIDISWHGVEPVLKGLHWPALLGLTLLWFLGLVVHSFVLTAAAPGLSRWRALTLNVTGSAVSNVVPLGGAAGIELNRRMMTAWGIGTQGFSGYTLLTNLWDVGSKLLLPVVAAIAIADDQVVSATPTWLIGLIGGVGFVALAGLTTTVVVSERPALLIARRLARPMRFVARLIRRGEYLDPEQVVLDLRRECAALVAQGWLQMSLGILGYVTLQGLLLAACLHLTGDTNSPSEILAAFAFERMLTILPITPGGVGVADLGLVATLLTFGGDPTAVAAGALLYRAFVFAIEIPVGGGALGAWLLGRKLAGSHRAGAAREFVSAQRIAHVTDVFLPRLGGIETHVDELASRQRERGLDAHVLTPTSGTGGDPPWVHRLALTEARQVIADFDVVHVHLSLVSPFSLRVARAAMAAGVPALVTVHSLWAGAGGVVRLAGLAALRRWPVAWSAVSRPAAEVFGRSLGAADVAVLPNAVDVATWRQAAENHPATEGPITIVSVMRLMPRKRPMQLVKIFARVRDLAPRSDTRLVIVGDGPLRRRVQRFVARRGLTEQVRITGRIPRSKVRDVLAAGGIYAAPAPKESFGIAALEARCAGLPVVAHRRSGVQEFIHDRIDGMLIDTDDEMAVAIADLVVDDALRHRITAHNRRVAPPFDWPETLDLTDALYRLAGDRAATGPRRQLRAVPHAETGA